LLYSNFAFNFKLRHYSAVLCGGALAAGDSGVVDTPLEGQPALTKWTARQSWPSDRYGCVTLVDMWQGWHVWPATSST
jgi:hypothetical protein